MMPAVAKRSKTSQLGRVLLLLISLAGSIVVLANAASSFLSPINPEIALKINPLNTDARIDLLARSLSSSSETGLNDKREEVATSGVALEPMDARFFSLLGILRERAGEDELAQELYQHALRLQPTEIQALSRRFVFNVNEARFVEAISIADTISRRWRVHWNLISPYLPYLLENEAAYNEALNRFASQIYGKQLMISSLIFKTNSLDLAYRLIIDWYERGESDLRRSINQLTAKLVSLGQNSRAFQIFRLTLSKTQEQESGYVFNANFNLEPSENLFDWNMAKQSGMNMSIRAMQFKTDNVGENVLETRFLNSPLRFSAVLQTLNLPQTDFTLKLTYSTRNLVVPKPIKLAIECKNTDKQLAVLELSAGDFTGKKIQSTFAVPEENCDLQQIRLFNGNVVESWSNRYSGSLLFHNVSIELGGN